MPLRQVRDDVSAFELHRLLSSGCPILDGQLLDIDIAASLSMQSVRHGLGRVYKGAALVACNVDAGWRALVPEGQAEPGTYLYFQLSAATAGSARVWVF